MVILLLFLTVMYHAQGVSLPVGFVLVAKTEHYLDKVGKPKRRSPISKNDYYQRLTHQSVTNPIPFTYVLHDVWYASAYKMLFVKHTLLAQCASMITSFQYQSLSGERGYRLTHGLSR